MLTRARLLCIASLLALGIATITIAYFLTESDEQRRDTARRRADSWTRHIPLGIWVERDFVRLQKDEFFPVIDAKQAQAQAALDDASWRAVSSEEAKDLLGREFPFRPNAKLVLLRGLYLEPSHGQFSVYWRDETVAVRYGCLGRHQVAVTRKAIVAYLPAIPKEVFVSCEMAQ